ncbi:MAG: hypothetical protein MUO84_05840, partial [Thermoplasmata archaeon]|nr:hypothetical protein [Thermoplasmata archaeon]
KIEDYCRSILDFEYTHGRPVTKEEAFRVCGVPYVFLGEVMDYLSGREGVSLSAMSKEDFEKFERISREILVNTMEKRDLANYGLRLCDISVNFPELRIASAKRVLSYIQAVEENDFSAKVTDPHIDPLLRQAMDLSNDQKNVLGLIRNLGIGVYQARQLVMILQTFQGAGFETPSIRIGSIVNEGYGEYVPYDESAAQTRPQGRQEGRASHGREDEVAEEQERPRRQTTRRAPRRDEEHEERPSPKKPKSRKVDEEESEEDVQSDLVGRRCLFHGGVAVTRCKKCKAVLCRECIRNSDRCPRCNALLSGEEDVAEKKPRHKPRQQIEELEEEIDEEEPDVEEESEEDPPLRKKAKKKEDKGPDFFRL